MSKLIAMLGGKGKMIMILTALAVAGVNTVVADPAEAATIADALKEYIPTIVAFLLAGGVATADAKVKVTESVTERIKAASKDKAPPILPSIEEERVGLDEDDFAVDWDEFEAKVSKRALRYPYIPKLKDGKPSPVAMLEAIKSVGRRTAVWKLVDVLVYGERIVQEAHARFRHITGFSFGEADQHLGDDNPDCPFTSVPSMCRRRGEGWYTALLEIRDAATHVQSVDRLAELDAGSGAWRERMGGTLSLFRVFYLAYLLAPQEPQPQLEVKRVS